LDEKIFITDETFSQQEKQIRDKSFELFADKSVGNQELVKKFEDLLRLKLNDKRSEFDSLNRKRLKQTMIETEIALNMSLKLCKEKISQVLELFSGNEDLNEINSQIKQKTIEMFEQKCIVKDSNFLNPYINKLEVEIDRSLIEMRQNFEIKIEDLNHFYNNTVNEAMDRCFWVFIICDILIEKFYKSIIFVITANQNSIRQKKFTIS